MARRVQIRVLLGPARPAKSLTKLAHYLSTRNLSLLWSSKRRVVDAQMETDQAQQQWEKERPVEASDPRTVSHGSSRGPAKVAHASRLRCLRKASQKHALLSPVDRAKDRQSLRRRSRFGRLRVDQDR